MTENKRKYTKKSTDKTTLEIPNIIKDVRKACDILESQYQDFIDGGNKRTSYILMRKSGSKLIDAGSNIRLICGEEHRTIKEKSKKKPF